MHSTYQADPDDDPGPEEQRDDAVQAMVHARPLLDDHDRVLSVAIRGMHLLLLLRVRLQISVRQKHVQINVRKSGISGNPIE